MIGAGGAAVWSELWAALRPISLLRRIHFKEEGVTVKDGNLKKKTINVIISKLFSHSYPFLPSLPLQALTVLLRTPTTPQWAQTVSLSLSHTPQSWGFYHRAPKSCWQNLFFGGLSFVCHCGLIYSGSTHSVNHQPLIWSSVYFEWVGFMGFVLRQHWSEICCCLKWFHVYCLSEIIKIYLLIELHY